MATARSRDRFAQLEALGAERCEMERPDLSQHIAGAKQFDAVLNLVGEGGLALKLHGAQRLTIAAWPALKAANGAVVPMSGNSALPGMASRRRSLS